VPSSGCAKRSAPSKKRAATRWITSLPNVGQPNTQGEDASAISLRLFQMKGGRIPAALSDYRGLANANQVTDWLREDADWLDRVLEREQERELDPHEQPIWEDTEEGREAIRLANKRVAEGLKPKHVTQAGWGE
jgi:hypothetical protein